MKKPAKILLIAAVVLAAAVCAALLGGRAYLSGRRNDALAALEQEGESRLAAARDLCAQLYTLGEGHLSGHGPEDPLTQLERSLEAADAALEGDADDLRWANARMKLESAAEEVRTALAGAETLTQGERTHLETLQTQLDTALAAMGDGPYNHLARQFNRTLRTFPWNLLGGLTGVQPLGIF